MKYIFLHGLGQTPACWNKTISYMEKQANIICVNLFDLLQGKEITYINLYDAFSEYCEKFPEPFNLCGLSLGGILALHYCIENPSKVNSMALIGTQYVMPKKLLKIQNAIFHIMPKRMFQQIGISKRDFINLSNSMMELDFRGDLKKVMCSVLIICGQKDKANKKASMELKEYLPHAEIQFIENAGHEVNVDAPELLGKMLNTFFMKDL